MTQAENQKIVKRRQSALLAAGFSIFVLHDSQRIGACIPLLSLSLKKFIEKQYNYPVLKTCKPPTFSLTGWGAGGRLNTTATRLAAATTHPASS